MRRAAATATPTPATSSSSATNSSPPKRASRSLFRTTLFMRAPIATRNSSPVTWPRLSLMLLKRSTSTKIRAWVLRFKADR